MYTLAWMLRQDGKEFACSHHLYAMGDDDLSSEAEVAAFLVSTDSKDLKLAYNVLDTWMAFLIEDDVSYDATEDDIQKAIIRNVAKLPYRFLYPLSSTQLLEIHDRCRNYFDVDSLYEYVDKCRDDLSSIQESIRKSVNQQFCRVRFGGQYNSSSGDRGIWYRISSVGFNWRDVIYGFTAKMYTRLGIQSIYICRDYESDNPYSGSGSDFFYTAKDGQVYYNMPISEYFSEQHESNPVFATKNVSLSSGYLNYGYNRLGKGDTYLQLCAELRSHNIKISSDIWPYYLRKEHKLCIDSSKFLDTAHVRTKNNMYKLIKELKRKYPEIEEIDIDRIPYPNTRGNLVGQKYLFAISSNISKLDGIVVDIAFLRSDISMDTLYKRFCEEYEDYKKYTLKS